MEAQATEARLLGDLPNAGRSLCVYCIARDEASQLMEWWESVRVLDADEVLIAVDSRSHDETFSLAQHLASSHPGVRALLFSLPEDLEAEERAEWEDMYQRAAALPDFACLSEEERSRTLAHTLHHFAGARNFALRQARADWILQVDCDERLTEQAKDILSELLPSLEGDKGLCMVRMEVQDDNGRPQQRFYAERLLRRGARYHDAMHNWVDVPAAARVLAAPLLLVHNRHHTGEEGRARRARQRILHAEAYFGARLEKNPSDQRALFYYASTLCDSERVGEALPYWLRYLDCVPPCAERYQGSITAARCAIQQGDKKKAKEVLLGALGDNWRRAESYLMLADLAADEGDIEEAEHWCRTASVLSDPVGDPMFVEVDAHSWMPWAKLNEIYHLMGNTEAARLARQAAFRCGIPAAEACYLKATDGRAPARLALFVDRGDDKFIAPLAHLWEKRGAFDISWYREPGQEQEGEVCSSPGDLASDLASCDIAWFEWASPLLVEATHRPKTCRIVVRVHGYEVYAPHFSQVDWSKVDEVIFVAHYLANLALQRCPEIARHCRTHVVPGGVDTSLFTLSRDSVREGNKFCSAGYLNSKKQTHWAFILFSRALSLIPDAQLHLCGAWQDGRVEKHCRTLARELGIADRVFWRDWASQEELARWYQDKDYFISCSYDESLHYALAEAMACGVKPLVHCWESARDFYPEECIFRDEREFLEVVHRARAGEMRQEPRQWVLDHLSLERNYRRVTRVLNAPAVSLVGALDGAWHIETKVVDVLEELGCRVTDPAGAEVCFLFPGSVRPHTEARCVYWDAEQLRGGSEHARDRRRRAQSVVDTLFLSDGDLCLYSQRDLYQGGWCPPFRPLGLEKKRDLIFYGALTERRAKFLSALSERGLAVDCVECFDHERLNRLLNESRIVLNLHCTDEPGLQTRICEALGAGTLVISEKFQERNPISWLTCQIPQFEGVDECARLLRVYLCDGKERESLARSLHRQVVSHLRLEQQVEKALERMGV